MKRALLLLLACCAPAAAQLELACARLPAGFSRAIFDHRTAKQLQGWECVISNRSQQLPEMVREADVQGWLIRQGVIALSSRAIAIGAPQIQRNGWKPTVGRISVHLATVATALAASEVIQIGPAWGAVAGFAALNLPVIGRALAERDPPAGNFQALAFADEISIEPGSSVAVTVFAARADEGPATVAGQLRPDAALLPILAFEPADLWGSAQARVAALRWAF